MYIHTGNHYFCPITHETDVNSALFQQGINWYSYADFSANNYYTNLFSPNNQNNTYSWGYALGNGGFDILDSIRNPDSTFGFGYSNTTQFGYSYMLGSGYEILDNAINPFSYNNFEQNPFNTHSNGFGYSYAMGKGYDILDQVTKTNNTSSTQTYNNNTFAISPQKNNQLTTQGTQTQQKTVKKDSSSNNQQTKTPYFTSLKQHITSAQDIIFAKSIADNAENYIGYNEKDGSFKKFSNSPEWCADFVTYVVKETYRQKGIQIPEGFGSWRCENLKQWAINNNKFLQLAGRKNKAELISQKVKPGDILILRENGASHTGIVKTINKKTGEFTTIEGNLKTNSGVDSVAINEYSAYNQDISGFIQLV